MTASLETKMPTLQRKNAPSKQLLIEEAIDMCGQEKTGWWKSSSPSAIRKEATRAVSPPNDNGLKSPSRNSSRPKKNSLISSNSDVGKEANCFEESSRPRRISDVGHRGRLPALLPSKNSTHCSSPSKNNQCLVPKNELIQGNDSHVSSFRKWIKNPLSRMGRKTPEASDEERGNSTPTGWRKQLTGFGKRSKNSSTETRQMNESKASTVEEKAEVEEPAHYDGIEVDQSDGKSVDQLQSELMALFTVAKQSGMVVETSEAANSEKLPTKPQSPPRSPSSYIRPTTVKTVYSRSGSSRPGASALKKTASPVPTNSIQVASGFDMAMEDIEDVY